ncbi:hypothetical protein SAMN05428982_1923 [Pseudoxanthomonas sp. CF385]|uniref:hypothetical protein n=1 Tax=Pseudoxanthomonas sp. CF385 TaxID=1881042 RepID=UPI00087EC709|nr:hypothetical protein [Pseudoxanthomonas sp. CF385]SDQ63978.1 hypothetical protein SAMN05428982_1923 [Pseudoxanthomonas sp. CF385]
MTNNRSTARAGHVQAGHTLDQEAAALPLADLLTPRTVAEADDALALIAARLEPANDAVAAHAEGRDDALLAGTEAEHDARGQRLADEARRLTVAAERLAVRREELIATEKRSRAERDVQQGRDAAQRAEDLTLKYQGLAHQLAEVLAELPGLHVQVERARRTAREHDLPTDGLVLPHETRSRSAEFETEEVEVVQHGPRVTDASGRSVQAGPQEPVARFTRSESRMVRPQVSAANLTTVHIELPAIDGGAAIVSQGPDRR